MPQKSTISPKSGKTPPAVDDGFMRFWNAYPYKTAKPGAIKAWEKINPDESMLEEILAGVDRWKRSRKWHDQDGKFIPHPATWLNARKWEDNPEPEPLGTPAPPPPKPAPPRTMTKDEHRDNELAKIIGRVMAVNAHRSRQKTIFDQTSSDSLNGDGILNIGDDVSASD